MPLPPPTSLRLADLAARRVTPFTVQPGAAECAALARALGIVAIRKLRFVGTLTPQDRRDWVLRADLGATVVQDCVATLAPVTTRIDEPVQRSYLAKMPEITGTEVEMPEDDTIEPLPDTIDLLAVMTEALTLALPLYPRVPGAQIDQAVYTEPGALPLTDERAKPFAGLGALRDRLKKPGD